MVYGTEEKYISGFGYTPQYLLVDIFIESFGVFVEFVDKRLI